MQTIDHRFLDNLKQKLSTGNRRSIYLNAIPDQYLTRLDVRDLDFLQEGLTNNFLDLLFGKANFDCKIQPTPSSIPATQKKQKSILRRLQSIGIENQDHFSEHGVKTFSFGFPILLMRDPKDPTKTIKAPLLIWSLDIERNFGSVNEWRISRQEDYAVVTNMVLNSYLMSQAKIQLQPIYDQLLEDAILDREELAKMVFLHLKQLHPTLPDQMEGTFRQILQQPLAPLPSSKKIAQMPLEVPTILWSGVFGLFRSQKESIIKDIAYFSANIDTINTQLTELKDKLPQGDSAFMKHAFTVVDTDPSQQKLLHQLDQGKNLIIQGPPGTGKSQILTGIIANTISNAGNCLVVCEKKTALDVIYNNLKELGLQELAVIIEDTHRDRRAVVDSVRERAKQQHKVYQPSPTFIRLLRSCTSSVQLLQKYQEKMRVPLSGDLTYKALVGQYLKTDQLKEGEAIHAPINPKNFAFNLMEHEEICNILEEGEYLFKKLGTMQHPLNALSDHFFRQANVAQVEKNIKQSLDSLSKVVQSAQRDMLAYLFEYEKLLERHYEDVYLQKSRKTSKMTDLIEAGMKTSKYYFNKNTGLYRGFLKNIGSKYKQLDDDKATILQTFIELKKTHQQYQYFDFNFLDISNQKKLVFEQLLENIESYQAKVYEWHEGRGPIIRDLVNELSPTKIYKHVHFHTKVQEVSKSLDIFEQKFASSQVFKVDFKFASRTIHKRHKQLEGLEQNLAKLQEQFENFADYHALKFFWLSLTDGQRVAMEQLIATNPSDWEKSFSSWYLNAMLSHHQDEAVPNEMSYNLTRKSYEKELAAFQRMLLPHTLKYWRGEQSRQVQLFHHEQAPLKLHSLYNKRGNKGERRNPLRKIIGVAPELFQSFFPVLLVSPSVCSSILPLHPGLFDVVLFDEASQLRVEDTFCALTRGKYKIISGDSQQMPPSDYFQAAQVFHNEESNPSEEIWDNTSLVNDSIDYLSSSESLLEFGLAEGYYVESFLEVHYRSKHPYLIDFSNAAFYGNRLTPVVLPSGQPPIKLVSINGTYADSCNEKEAVAVVDYLVQIAKKYKKTPSVGVATFNLHQRNLILDHIQTRAIEQPEEGSLLQRLFSAGLFVKNLENIQGDERDFLVISTTFGKRADDSFIQNYGPINKQDGYRLLNVIITRAKKHIQIFTSIPANYYQNYRADILKNGNQGKGIFYAYLAYANAVSTEDDDTRKAILDLVLEHCQQKPIEELLYSVTDTTFEEHIINYLQQSFADARIEVNYQYAGMRLPIAIFDANNELKVVLYYDIFIDKDTPESYAWDIFVEQRLEAMQIACYRVWSNEWWENTAKAQEKLLKQIEQHILL